MGCSASVQSPHVRLDDVPPEKPYVPPASTDADIKRAQKEVPTASPVVSSGDISCSANHHTSSTNTSCSSSACSASSGDTSSGAALSDALTRSLREQPVSATDQLHLSNSLRKMQKVFRGIVLRRRVVEHMKFSMWNQLDEWEELELLTVGKMIEDMVRGGGESQDMGEASATVQDWTVANSNDTLDIEPDEPESGEKSQSFNNVPASTTGTSSTLLPEKLQPSDVITIVGSLQHGERLPRGVVAELLQRQVALLRSQPNVLRMNVTPNQTLAVVGDLHGQLADLLHIFALNGLPSESTMYLFNGDFVDRGPKSLEVVLCLFAWQQCFPQSVFLNRGNHEESAVNAMYGFLADCAIKYDREIYNMFDEAFRWLPLATIVDNVTLVLHAGVATGLTIKMLEDLPRAKYTMDVKRDGSTKPAHFSRVVETVLWSDPQPKSGCVSNKKRGVGCRFGPDVAAEFMKQEGIKLLVRSHECVMEGLEWPFGGPDVEPRVCTLFSASNYGCKTLNKGAFLLIQHGTAANPRPVKYEAEQVSTQQVDLRNLKFVAQLIVERKVDLRHAFNELDSEHTGYVSISQWAEAIGKTLGLHLPWMNLQPLLASNHTSGKGIAYEGFLQQFQPQASRTGGLTKDQTALIEILCSRCQHLGAILLRMDRDGTGVVSVDEIGRIFRMVGQRFPEARALFVEHPENILKLLGIEPTGDGTIQIDSFVDAFRVKADWIAEKQVPTAGLTLTNDETGKQTARPSDPRAVFKLARMVQKPGKAKKDTATILMHTRGSGPSLLRSGGGDKRGAVAAGPAAMRSSKNLCG